MKNWNPITTTQDVLNIIENSVEKPQIIFKDSVTCGISAYAKERLVSGNDLLIAKADFNYLDLLSYRSVSNFIADELNVIHQSPQIIVLKNKEVVYRVSHHSIQAEEIAKWLSDCVVN
jgi:bacillithiol system protein YtxJ